jgi:O-antigen/teichoic acid export membrane protein
LASIVKDVAAGNLAAAARGSVGIFLLRVVGTGLGFVVGILMARLLGAEGFGVVVYASAWTSVVLIASTLGFQQLLPREVARYHSQAEWGLLRGLLAFSRTTVLLCSVSLAGITAMFAWALIGFDAPSTITTTLWIALVGVPLSSLIQVRQGIMRGLGHVVRGHFPEMLLAPALSCAVFATIYLFYDFPLRPQEVVSIGLVITASALFIGNRILNSVLPDEIRSAKPVTARRTWLSSATPMIMIAGLEVINSQTDIVMLGAMTTADQTGIYTVAARAASLVTFALGSVNMAIGPMMARNYYAGDHSALQEIVRKSAIAIFLFTAPICAGLYFFGEQFLSLYGAEFTEGQMALNFLLIGNLINALAGSVGLILKMTGHERDVLWTGTLAALTNVGLNALLIPKFGIEGAAIATTISISIWPVAAGAMVFRRLGINPTVFGPLRLTEHFPH